jgi:hypothetical protein
VPESSKIAQDRQDARDQVNRVWAHVVHEDEDFVQRGNFFLVAESMLVVAYSAILSTGQAGSARHRTVLAAAVIAGFGFLLTMVWGYVSHHQLLHVRNLRGRATQLLPEYRKTQEIPAAHRVSPTALMTYLVPVFAGIMWLLLLLLLVP